LAACPADRAATSSTDGCTAAAAEDSPQAVLLYYCYLQLTANMSQTIALLRSCRHPLCAKQTIAKEGAWRDTCSWLGTIACLPPCKWHMLCVQGELKHCKPVQEGLLSPCILADRMHPSCCTSGVHAAARLQACVGAVSYYLAVHA
jgi:hypothetical protein